MYRRNVLLSVGALVLAACGVTRTPRQLGADGLPLPSVYRISDPAQVQFRVLDSVNALRSAAGAPPLSFSAELNAAAETHSRDMSLQNRPWHFGSDGSSPIDRARRAGYRGTVLGENISETYETEVETLTAWMSQPDTRDVITDPNARDLGFAWYQEPNGKIWWTLVTGDGGSGGPANAPRG
ncbi:CAP domain-containing protein [Rhodobacterales bacterium HKCCE3408]|nr:CAP domain-containing protein [Rhodobacterales bacterium HKCCE3408]